MRNKIIVLFSAAVLLSSCGNTAQSSDTKVFPRVKVIRAELSEVNNGKTYISKVEAGRSVLLSSPFPAQLKSMNVQQGDFVRSGTVLAELYSESIESTFSIAAANLSQAQDAYSRIDKVRDNGGVSPLKITEVETALQKAESAMRTARKSKDDCSIRAPFEGVVSETFAEVGCDLGISQPVVKIVDLNSLELVISVPEAELSKMKISRRARVSVPALELSNLTARVTRKGITAAAFSHSYDVVLKLDSRVSGLMPGMSAKVLFDDNASDAFIIPASAVRTDVNGTYVWTVQADSLVSKRYISTSEFAECGVIVRDGLEEGEMVIVEGSSKVSSGMKVAL